MSADVCILPRVVGPCSGSFRQWYYDSARDSCYEFDYGGCQGNPNRFNNAHECQQRCQRVRAPPTTTTTESPYYPRAPDREREDDYERERDRYPPPQQGDMCGLSVDPGPCRASIPAWYYNRETYRCEAFSYGGCDGNANRFQSEEQCERQCGSFRGQGKKIFLNFKNRKTRYKTVRQMFADFRPRADPAADPSANITLTGRRSSAASCATADAEATATDSVRSRSVNRSASSGPSCQLRATPPPTPIQVFPSFPPPLLFLFFRIVAYNATSG